MAAHAFLPEGFNHVRRRLIYAKRIRAMKELGYHVEIIYLQLASSRRKPRGVRRECMERRSTCGRTAKSSQSAPDAAASCSLSPVITFAAAAQVPRLMREFERGPLLEYS